MIHSLTTATSIKAIVSHSKIEKDWQAAWISFIPGISSCCVGDHENAPIHDESGKILKTSEGKTVIQSPLRLHRLLSWLSAEQTLFRSLKTRFCKATFENLTYTNNHSATL